MRISTIILLLCLISTKTWSQGEVELPYNLPIPQGWAVERIEFPISFAPEIPYTGVEDIRFAPGWAKLKSDEYWTYAFLWYLDGTVKTDAKIIADNLKSYYTGLIESNLKSHNVPAEKLIPVTTSFKEISKYKDDSNTYSGTIKMLDYMQQQPITLNCIVHLKYRPKEKKTLLFFELSPKPLGHSNWEVLDKLWSE